MTAKSRLRLLSLCIRASLLVSLSGSAQAFQVQNPSNILLPTTTTTHKRHIITQPVLQARPSADTTSLQLPVDFLPLAAGVCPEVGQGAVTITQGQSVSVCLSNPYYLTYSVTTLIYFDFTATVEGVGSYTQPAVTDGTIDAFTTVMTCTLPNVTESQSCRWESFLVDSMFDFLRQNGQTSSSISATGKAALVETPVQANEGDRRGRALQWQQHYPRHLGRQQQQVATAADKRSVQEAMMAMKPPTRTGSRADAEPVSVS